MILATETFIPNCDAWIVEHEDDDEWDSPTYELIEIKRLVKTLKYLLIVLVQDAPFLVGIERHLIFDHAFFVSPEYKAYANSDAVKACHTATQSIESEREITETVLSKALKPLTAQMTQILEIVSASSTSTSSSSSSSSSSRAATAASGPRAEAVFIPIDRRTKPQIPALAYFTNDTGGAGMFEKVALLWIEGYGGGVPFRDVDWGHAKDRRANDNLKLAQLRRYVETIKTTAAGLPARSMGASPTGMNVSHQIEDDKMIRGAKKLDGLVGKMGPSVPANLSAWRTRVDKGPQMRVTTNRDYTAFKAYLPAETSRSKKRRKKTT